MPKKSQRFTLPTVDDIVKELKKDGRYTPTLRPMLAVLDSALTSLRIMLKQLRIWESELTDGAISYDDIAQSPLWKRLREAEDSCRKLLKELNLNAEGTKSSVQDDPLLELTDRLQSLMTQKGGGND